MPPVSPHLWIVATPLGNIDDLSPRARSILASADCILAEDTRRAQHLLSACAIKNPCLVSFHDHNEDERMGEVVSRLRAGQRIALISDAGTPLLADPGYRLVRLCRRENIPVSPVPGPSAPIAALSAAGLPPLPSSFLGFLPRDDAGRRRLFSSFATVPGSLVFFERADRLARSLELAGEILGKRDFVICRELTKTFEEFIPGRLGEKSLPSLLQGEITVVIGPPEEKVRESEEMVRSLLESALQEGGSIREVVRRVQREALGWSGRELYRLCGEMRQVQKHQEEL